MKGKKLDKVTQTSCPKMQCLGFSSERCVGGWLFSLTCSSYDGRNSVGVFIFGLGETTCSAETAFLLGEEDKLSCMWLVFLLLYARLEIFFSCSKNPCHFLLLSYVLMIYSPWNVFFHTVWVLGWWNWTKDGGTETKIRCMGLHSLFWVSLRFLSLLLWVRHQLQER